MARFQIFIPSNPESDAEPTLESVGLQHLGNGDAKLITGPDGKQGKLFAWLDPRKARMDYAPEKQTWIANLEDGDLKTGSYYVGIWNDDPPTEQDLRRHDHRRGRFVELGNGEKWIVTTPHTLERYPQCVDGKLVWCVDEEYNWLSTELERMRESIETDGEHQYLIFDTERDFLFLCRLLAINYLMTPEVCVLLKLVSEHQVKEMVAALIGRSLKG